MNDNIATPFAKPLYVMLKPAGAHCNLACKYCYYLEKNHLYQNTPRHLMSDEMLEQFTREYIEAQTMPQVLFTWHGGEPLMRSIDFYRKALELQKKYAHGKQIDNVIQTMVRILCQEPLAGRHFHRRTSGVSRPLSRNSCRKAFLGKGDAGHQPAEETSGGMECYGGG